MMIREPFAEFLGVAILIIFGNGVDCQAVLSMDSRVASFPHGVSCCMESAPNILTMVIRTT